MSERLNTLQWDGDPGHYEVYYLSATDHASGLGFWIRYTMLAPLSSTGQDPACALWLMAMDPQTGQNSGYKQTFPISVLETESDPFKLHIGKAELSDFGMSGEIDGGSWDLSWQPSLPAYQHVHPLIRGAKVAKTLVVLPHPDLEVKGNIHLGSQKYELEGARGGQAHLWGSKHGPRWAWLHCNDLISESGEERPGDFIDGVSVYLARMGREIGPATPVVGRFGGEDFISTSPLRVARNHSDFGLTSWNFEVRDGRRKVTGKVETDHSSLVGVTYHDPDGELAYCYNTEIATLQLQVWERSGRDWGLVDTLKSAQRAHFEYAQREPVSDVELLVK